uniref:CABIT domain-containing protein n=1 Tax=Strongyloides venezuelensis TaxID=75913 RepID=A0A0K0EY59_STRVS
MSFPLNESCINYNDVHYLNLDTVVVGKGRDRIKYLDLEGRWRRSGASCSAITNAFNHLEKLNYSTLPLSDLGECSLNAIRGPTPFTIKTTLPIKKTPIVIPTEPITVIIQQEVPPSPREIPPYRSLGYGEAHQKRRLSIPAERSRSPSLSSRNASPVPSTYDSTITKGNINKNDYITNYILSSNALKEEKNCLLSPGSGYYSDTSQENIIKLDKNENIDVFSDSSSLPSDLEQISVSDDEWVLEEEIVRKWSSKPSNKDLGYSSAPSSGYPSPRMQDDQELPRPPHRTQPLSPLPSPRSAFDSEYDSSYLYKASKETNESFQDIRMSLRESRRRLVYGK